MKTNNNIALIGPMSAGKSTLAILLAQNLERERIEADEYRWDYYEEIDYDHAKVKEIMEKGSGYLEMFAYWKPFEAHLVERIIEDHAGAVIDFGAGHTVHEDPKLFQRVKTAMETCAHVLLILPNDDREKSLIILNKRLETLLLREIGLVPPETLETNRHFLEHKSNEELATSIFYSDGKSPEELAAEIIDKLELT